MSLNEFSVGGVISPSLNVSTKKTLWTSCGKRSFDVAFSICALICSLPLLVLLSILVKISSPGPVFYCSTRIGKNGTLFKFWKFRTMYTDAEYKLQILLAENPELRKEWKQFFKLKNDPRLTSMGRFLRKTSLDEFPQFWNVLKGDLSVVGPRPFLPNETAEIRKTIGDQISQLFSCRPGLTGIWQTSGRSDLTFQQRVILDLPYAKQSSLLFDLKLILKTIPMLLFPKGAF